MPAPPKARKKKTKRDSLLLKSWWVAPVLACVALIAWIATGPRWTRPQISAPVGRRMAGYDASTRKMTQEYLHYYGKALNNPAIERAFDQANQRVSALDYAKAIALLEQVSKVAAVPVVFNNLGVLYAELIDTSGAVNAFREALARDIDYPAVRSNLERMKDLMALGADPVVREVEPNNDAATANIIAPGKAVEGELDAAFHDEDFFRVTTPPAPRDLISIEISNRAPALAPVLKIFDAERRITNWGKTAWEPGASLQQTIAPPPNTTLYLQVSGYLGSAGRYTLLVRPRKLFDPFEPNDDIYNSRRIALGTPVAAGIMDADDTDFYSFVSPRTGTVSIAIDNRSTTLIPALTTFNSDMRSSGSGPDVRTPGMNLRQAMKVQQDQVYYIQVRSLTNTSGGYSLIVE